MIHLTPFHTTTSTTIAFPRWKSQPNNGSYLTFADFKSILRPLPTPKAWKLLLRAFIYYLWFIFLIGRKSWRGAGEGFRRFWSDKMKHNRYDMGALDMAWGRRKDLSKVERKITLREQGEWRDYFAISHSLLLVGIPGCPGGLHSKYSI